MKTSILSLLVACLIAVQLQADIVDPNRYVQIQSVDFQTGVVQLTNFDSISKDLSGWRFCTHDEDQIRQYSGTFGLNGVTLNAGASLLVHFNNDASASNEINISTIGGNFAGPLDIGPDPGGAFAIGLYVNSSFGNGNNLADHIQWSYDGADNSSADERSDEAEGEVWLDQTDWISADNNTARIDLNVADFDNEIHSSSNYLVTVPEPATGLLITFGLTLGSIRRRRKS